MNVIYFDEDSKRNAKQYAQDAKAQQVCNKISNGIEKVAIGSCLVVSIIAIAIIAFVMFF